MGPLDILLHLLNFFAPAVAVGLLSATMTKWLWRRRLAGVRWRSLGLWATASAAAASVAALLAFGRDGTLAAYVLMVVSGATGLWWAGFVRRR